MREVKKVRVYAFEDCIYINKFYGDTTEIHKYDINSAFGKRFKDYKKKQEEYRDELKVLKFDLKNEQKDWDPQSNFMPSDSKIEMQQEESEKFKKTFINEALETTEDLKNKDKKMTEKFSSDFFRYITYRNKSSTKLVETVIDKIKSKCNEGKKIPRNYFFKTKSRESRGLILERLESELERIKKIEDLVEAVHELNRAILIATFEIFATKGKPKPSSSNNFLEALLKANDLPMERLPSTNVDQMKERYNVFVKSKNIEKEIKNLKFKDQSQETKKANLKTIDKYAKDFADVYFPKTTIKSEIQSEPESKQVFKK